MPAYRLSCSARNRAKTRWRHSPIGCIDSSDDSAATGLSWSVDSDAAHSELQDYHDEYRYIETADLDTRKAREKRRNIKSRKVHRDLTASSSWSSAESRASASEGYPDSTRSDSVAGSAMAEFAFRSRTSAGGVRAARTKHRQRSHARPSRDSGKLKRTSTGHEKVVRRVGESRDPANAVGVGTKECPIGRTSNILFGIEAVLWDFIARRKFTGKTETSTAEIAEENTAEESNGVLFSFRPTNEDTEELQAQMTALLFYLSEFWPVKAFTHFLRRWRKRCSNMRGDHRETTKEVAKVKRRGKKCALPDQVTTLQRGALLKSDEVVNTLIRTIRKYREGLDSQAGSFVAEAKPPVRVAGTRGKGVSAELNWLSKQTQETRLRVAVLVGSHLATSISAKVDNLGKAVDNEKPSTEKAKVPVAHHSASSNHPTCTEAPVNCNGCGAESIAGFRFKCDSCPDVNFCSKCFTSKAFLDHCGSEHRFRLLVRFQHMSDAALPQEYIPLDGVFSADLRARNSRPWRSRSTNRQSHRNDVRNPSPEMAERKRRRGKVNCSNTAMKGSTRHVYQRRVSSGFDSSSDSSDEHPTPTERCLEEVATKEKIDPSTGETVRLITTTIYRDMNTGKVVRKTSVEKCAKSGRVLKRKTRTTSESTTAGQKPSSQARSPRASVFCHRAGSLHYPSEFFYQPFNFGETFSHPCNSEEIHCGGGFQQGAFPTYPSNCRNVSPHPPHPVCIPYPWHAGGVVGHHTHHCCCMAANDQGGRTPSSTSQKRSEEQSEKRSNLPTFGPTETAGVTTVNGHSDGDASGPGEAGAGAERAPMPSFSRRGLQRSSVFTEYPEQAPPSLTQRLPSRSPRGKTSSSSVSVTMKRETPPTTIRRGAEKGEGEKPWCYVSEQWNDGPVEKESFNLSHEIRPRTSSHTEAEKAEMCGIISALGFDDPELSLATLTKHNWNLRAAIAELVKGDPL